MFEDRWHHLTKTIVRPRRFENYFLTATCSQCWSVVLDQSIDDDDDDDDDDDNDDGRKYRMADVSQSITGESMRT